MRGKQRGKGLPLGGVGEEQPVCGALERPGWEEGRAQRRRPAGLPGCEGPREPPKALKQGRALTTAMLRNNLSGARMERSKEKPS